MVVPMNRKASLPTHAQAQRRRRHAFVRGDNERISPLVREIVILLEHGKLYGTKLPTDFGEREPADFDEAEEPLEHKQAVVLVRIAHVPVGRDERRHGVEHLGSLARVEHRLVFKVADFDPGREETLPAILRLSARRRGGPSRLWLGRERRVRVREEVVWMVLRARLGRIR